MVISNDLKAQNSRYNSIPYILAPPLSKTPKEICPLKNPKTTDDRLCGHTINLIYTTLFTFQSRKILVFLRFCCFFQKLIHCALLMAPGRNVTLCYGQKALHRFCDSSVFLDQNLSKWPLGRRFSVFLPKKRLHISSVQDIIIDVRVCFLVPRNCGKSRC